MKEKLLLYLFLTVGLMSMKAGDTTSVSITGYVKDEAGRGIKGVVVNNGINFTTTDRKGAWTLPTDTLACRFISISTPSGYALPAANGLAHGFYKDVRAAMSDEQNVFVLHRREKPATRFHYIAISDPQVRTHDDMKRWTTETMRDIMHSADSLRRTGEVVAVTLGDLVFDNMTFLSKFATTMLNDRMTVFQCIGNHDFNKAYAGAANMQPGATRYAEQNFCRQFGPLNYSFNIGKAHVVTINNISYRGSHKYEETIMPADMEWLKKDLSYVPDSALILINMHAPAWNTNEKQDNITNAEELKEVACRTQRARVLRAHSFLRERGGDRTTLPAQHRSRVRSMVDKQHEPLRSTQRLSDSRHQRDSHKMELQGDKPPERLPDAALQARRVPHAEQICSCQHMGLGPSLPRGMVSGRQVHGAHGTDQRRR